MHAPDDLLASPNRDLEPSVEAFRDMVDAAMREIAEHLRGLDAADAHVPTAAGLALARRLIEPLPETGASFEALLEFLFREAIPKRCSVR